MQYSQRNDINVSQQYITFEKVFKESLENYKQNISKKWKDVEISTPSKWVQYSNKYNFKKTIDFKNKTISVEVISKNTKTAQKSIEILFKQLLSYGVVDAYNNDLLNQMIYSKLQIIADISIQNTALIYDAIERREQDKIITGIILQEYETRTYQGSNIFKASYKLDDDFTNKKFILYKTKVSKHAHENNIPEKILFSSIYINTFYNPMAINTNTINYGLLQISPKNTANKAFVNIYGYEKFIDSKYLYDSDNNLKLASIQISEFYNNTFKDILDDESKLFCTLIAYKYGLKKIKDIFTEKDTIQNINNLIATKVYRKIIKQLELKKDKLYFSKMVFQMRKYK